MNNLNLLAFDTSTEHLFIGVQRRGNATAWLHTGPGGALTSTHLIPQIQALMAQAQLRFEELDAIVFGAGPGSFTGLRTACSVAQGLAFGAGVPVLPVDTLLAVAEEARAQLDAGDGFRVTALLDARMDEMYAASYSFNSELWRSDKGYRLIKPENFACNASNDGDEDGVAGDAVLAGNVFAVYGARLPERLTRRINALPTAAALLRLAPALLAAGCAVSAAQALPTYIRDKVAQTTRERDAIKLANAALAANGVAP